MPEAEKFKLPCPVQPDSEHAKTHIVGDECKVTGSVPGMRRHVRVTHMVEKDLADALIDAALIAAGRPDLIKGARRSDNTATQIHWVDTLPDTELLKLQKKLGLFLKKDMPRDERIALIKERADAKGLNAVPTAV
jgi:hypothetical protein